MTLSSEISDLFLSPFNIFLFRYCSWVLEFPFSSFKALLKLFYIYFGYVYIIFEHILLIAILKSLSTNSNMWVILGSVSIDYFLPCL